MTISSALFGIFFPPKCVFCGCALPVGEPLKICAGCSRRLPYYAGEYLFESGRACGSGGSSNGGSGGSRSSSSSSGAGSNGGSGGSRSSSSSGAAGSSVSGGASDTCDRIVCALKYTNIVRGALSRYKFHNRREYGMTLAALLCERLARAEGAACACGFDCVTCVPLSRGRMLERGYNQSAILAEYAAQYLGLPYEGGLLVRTEHALRQSTLRRGERYENVKSAFRIGGSADIVLPGARMLLVDDIATSMATINACAAVLKAAGAAEVVGAVLASA